MAVEAGHVEESEVLEEGGNGDRTNAMNAVVFIPGLELGLSPNRTFAGVSQKLAAACDRQSPDRPAQFASSARPSDLGGAYAEMDRSTISITSDGTTAPHIDVYQFRWAAELTKRWESQGSRSRLLRGVIGFWYGLKLFLFSFGNAARTGSARRATQALIVLAALLVVSVYLVGLLAAAVTVVLDWIGAPPSFSDLLQQVVVVLTAALTFLLPSLHSRIPTVGATLLATSDYVRLPDQHLRIAGELTGLVEALAETGRHERIHIVGYSMGGIIAFDAVCPTGASVKSLEAVSSLTTIGAPYEAVRATRPTYFDRRRPPGTSAPWTSYWAEADVLSSPAPRPKKQDDLDLGRQTPHPVVYDLPADLRFPAMLTMAGLASHAMYWGPDGEADRNVFEEIVVQLGLVASPASTEH